jgi:peptide/nickel transport system permease protein
VAALDAAVPSGAPRRSSFRPRRVRWAILAWLLGLVLVVCAVAPGLVSQGKPNDQDIAASLKPPVGAAGGSWSHPLGTDANGRDVLTRVIYAARPSLEIAFSAMALGLLLGAAIGVLGGYFRGRLGWVAMRLADLQMSIPFLVLALAILSTQRPTTWILIVTFALATWPIYGRVIASLLLLERNRGYVQAARVLGIPEWRILVRHVAPVIAPAIVVAAVLDLGNIILLEAVVSYLGIGVQPPQPSWGNMMQDGSQILLIGDWWISAFAGLAIFLALLAVNVIAEDIRNRSWVAEEVVEEMAIA